MKIQLDGREIEIDGKKTILELCKDIDLHIPTLCYHPNLKPESRCRVCLVDMDGKLVTSCSTYPHENAVISTDSDRVLKARKRNMELLMPNLQKCELGDDNEVCEIYNEVGIENNRFNNLKNYLPDLGDAVIRDNNKCINCGRCVQVCSKIQAINAIDFAS
ncbi:MAG: (2Fe-2S)-binding protein, partial [Nanoarchaeota archaeon]|nr:(2Fe-2S)-binding protein [Nanoarchaeota archaeon]